MKTATAANPCCRRCGRYHRSWRAVALCRWPRAEWVAGAPAWRGPCYASVSLCPGYGRAGVTAILYATAGEAHAAKSLIDRLACGGGCSRQHCVVALSRDGGRGDA
jgi:hypothetical protein